MNPQLVGISYRGKPIKPAISAVNSRRNLESANCVFACKALACRPQLLQFFLISTRATSKVHQKMSKKEKILKGSPEHRIERRRFLTQLVHEYTRTNSKEARQQVMANLANFAYDPYNYEFFRELKVTDVFLYEIENARNPKLVEFAVAAICNCSADDALRQEIIERGGIPLIGKLLNSSESSTVISAIGSLITLVTPLNRHEVLTPEIRTEMENLNRSENPRIRNLATIFLSDNL